MWRPASSRSRPCLPQRLLFVVLAAAILTLGCSAPAKDKEDGAAAGQAAGGDGTLQGKAEQDLLKWALSHSDPDALRAAAAEARQAADAGSPEFAEKQRRVQALLDAMKGEPTEAELMQEAVAILRNASSTHEQLGNALEALRYLVEPIDNANNLQGMGGLAPVIAFLGRQQPSALQAKAAHLLGTAASNNNVFQEQLLGAHPEALPLLLHLLPSGGSSAGSSGSGSGGGSSEDDVLQQQQAEEAAVKALYCLSAFLRLSAPARSAFYEVGGLPTLQALLAAPAAHGGSPRLKRKGLTLLADLVQLDSAAQHGAAGLDQGAAVAAALQLLDVAALPDGERDTDMQEKALLVLLALLHGEGAPGQGAAQPTGAAALIAEAGGEAIVQRLEDAWRREAEAAAAAGQEDGEDPSFMQELVALCRRVRQHVAVAREQAGGTAHVAGSLGGGNAMHDSSEL